MGRAQARLGSLLKKALARAQLGSKEARLEVARLELGSMSLGSKLGSARYFWARKLDEPGRAKLDQA